jgi:hypothetical protein
LIDNNGQPYLAATFYCPWLDDYMIENAAVMCYLIEGGTDNQLPYIRPRKFNELDEPYSQIVSYIMEPGYITFIIEANDSDFPIYLPDGDMEFKVTTVSNYMH